jgi:hypothetical protein
MKAATWPDEIRERQSPFHNRFDPDIPGGHGLHHGKFDGDHFKDTLLIEGNFPPPPNAPRTIITGLNERIATLKAPSSSDEDKAVSLSWVLHLCGDIHQPLHCATRVNQEFPAGDHGGNEFAISVNGTPKDLHAFWDDLLGTDQNPNPHVVLSAAATISSELPRGALDEVKNSLSFDDWTNESFWYAKTYAYLNGQLPGVSEDAIKKNHQIPVPPVPSDYEPNAARVAHRRIAAAGYRLADQLTSAVGRQ